jgi:DNA modification methylase
MTVRILIGDCRERLAELPDASAHCCITSPPYFGLRDYGVAGQMGLEPTPDEFVAGMVEVFREVRRVLRDDGTLWVNIGDTYQNQKGQSGGIDPKQPARRHLRSARPQDGALEGFKRKDLIGVPWMLAFALRADGWTLRQDIIWSKPNPMPESVRDRCTKAHEYLFLLSKGPRYYFDAEAIREDAVCTKMPGRGMTDTRETYGPQNGGNSGLVALRNRLNDQGAPDTTRNKRSVWEVATQPFSEAHFATYPPALIEPCILAGCPKGGTVLDPFGGAGTTGLVADRLQRDAILIELNGEYAALAQRRIGDEGGMFTEVLAA